MRVTRDKISALFFLALSIAFGVIAQDIELYAYGDEPFTARTFPTALAIAGGGVSFLMLALPSGDGEGPSLGEVLRYDWPRVAMLCGLMVVYGLTITTVGFFVSTSLFLILGYLILGERRPWMLFMASMPVVAAFQFILHGIMDIYIVDPVLSALGIVR